MSGTILSVDPLQIFGFLHFVLPSMSPSIEISVYSPAESFNGHISLISVTSQNINNSSGNSSSSSTLGHVSSVAIKNALIVATTTTTREAIRRTQWPSGRRRCCCCCCYRVSFESSTTWRPRLFFTVVRLFHALSKVTADKKLRRWMMETRWRGDVIKLLCHYHQSNLCHDEGYNHYSYATCNCFEVGQRTKEV